MDDGIILHLIRHEKTAANKARQYIGWTDEPIVTEPIHMSLSISPTKVYGSDLIRCAQTAALYFPTAEYTADLRLREINFGDFEMKTYEELKDNPLYRAWIDSPGNNTPQNGEPFTTFERRIMKAINQIVQEAGDYTFVVHGGVIRILLSHFAPTAKDFQQIMSNHRMLYKLKWATLKDFQGGVRCKSYSEEPITERENTL